MVVANAAMIAATPFRFDPSLDHSRMVGYWEAIPAPFNSFADVGGQLAVRIALRLAFGARHPFLNRSVFGHFPGANSTSKLLSRSIQTT